MPSGSFPAPNKQENKQKFSHHKDTAMRKSMSMMFCKDNITLQGFEQLIGFDTIYPFFLVSDALCCESR
jgi:hypothetical protein